MTVEAASYISQLDATLPAAGDPRSQGDDHLRLTKSVLQTQFPNLGAAAVTPTAAQLNFVTGVTSAIQTQLDAKATIATTGLVLIATATASGSATIDFTTGIDGTYEEYELHIIEAVPTITADLPWIRTSANAGSSWDSGVGDYDYVHAKDTGTATTVANGSTTATKIVLAPTGPDSGTSGGFSAVLRFGNPAGTTNFKRIAWVGSAAAQTSPIGAMMFIRGAGARANVAALNGFRFLYSTGTIAGGKFKLYGAKK